MSASFNDQMDQQIVMDSDRKMTSYSSSTKQQHRSSQNFNSVKKQTIGSTPTTNTSITMLSISHSAHPISCIATAIFKCLSLFTYLFVGAFVPNVITFILVVVMAALDFWVVKNVTGRLLVGLRWWSHYDDKGNQIWKFQSFNKQYKPNAVDQNFFWGFQIGNTVIWAFFLIGKIFSLSLFWGTLTAINFGLSGMNLYGYYMCRGEYKKKLSNLKADSLRMLAGKLFIG